MSDGGLEGGLSYWATIKIEGNLTKDQLRAVTAKLREILDSKVTNDDQPEVDPDNGVDIEGRVVQAARLAKNTTDPEVTVAIKSVKKVR